MGTSPGGAKGTAMAMAAAGNPKAASTRQIGNNFLRIADITTLPPLAMRVPALKQ